MQWYQQIAIILTFSLSTIGGCGGQASICRTKVRIPGNNIYIGPFSCARTYSLRNDLEPLVLTNPDPNELSLIWAIEEAMEAELSKQGYNFTKFRNADMFLDGKVITFKDVQRWFVYDSFSSITPSVSLAVYTHETMESTPYTTGWLSDNVDCIPIFESYYPRVKIYTTYYVTNVTFELKDRNNYLIASGSYKAAVGWESTREIGRKLAFELAKKLKR